MENKRLNNYLKRTLGEHYSYMPKGELKVNSSKGIVEFTFNPAKVSKRFIEACLDKNGLYQYITESTSEKVVMKLPLDESTDESMMTPTALTFTGKRTLQCDKDGKEILHEKIDPNEDEDFRYHISLYYDENRRGLEDEFQTDDYDVVEEYVWEYIQKGSYITVWDQETMRKVDLDPDDYDYETDDLYSVLDDLKRVSPFNPDNTDGEWVKKAFTVPLGTEPLTEEVEESEDTEVEDREEVDETEDDEEGELELNIDDEEEIDEPEDDIDSQFAELARKTVYDADGFMTDYTLYLDRKSDRYICIFGDQDFYRPGETTPDAEFEKREDAEEWFSVYDGVTESEEVEDEEELELNIDEEEPEDEELELKTDEGEEVEEESLQLREDSSNSSNKEATDIVVDVLRLFPDVKFVDQRDLGNGKIKLIFNHELTPSKLKVLKSWLDNEGLDHNLSKVALTIVAPWKSQMVGKLESLKRLNLKESLEEVPYEGWTIKPFEVTSIEYGEDKYPGFTHYMIQRDRDGAYLSDKSMKSVLRGLKLDGDTTACNTVDKAKKVIDYINSLKFLDEDYWFGGNGKMEIPERDNLQPGDQELEIKTDDVTKDNEDQNEEEQEEELNEEKKVSFKDVHKCDVCGKPLSQCICEVKEDEDLKENRQGKIGNIEVTYTDKYYQDMENNPPPKLDSEDYDSEDDIYEFEYADDIVKSYRDKGWIK